VSVDLSPYQEFWDRHEVLKQIKAIADSRMIVPWALLGVTMARVLSAAPPQIMIPPIINAPASLNFFVAITGPSGAGKSGAIAASRRYITIPNEAETKNLGSGEGLAMVFLEPDPNAVGRGPKPLVRNLRLGIVFNVDEITTLGELGSRDGSTIQSVLRSAWSGGDLGQSNASVDRDRFVAGDSYRLTMICGVQPRRSQVLFREDGSGSPQRFVWMPAIDPNMPEPEPGHYFSTTQSLAIDMPRFPDNHYELTVCPEAWDAVHRANWEKQVGRSDGLDGHLLLCQLKVAAALTILCDKSLKITTDWWEAAGTVMAVSNETRAWAAGGAYEEMRENAIQRGSEFGISDAQKDNAKADEICRRVGGNILKYMDNYNEPVSKSQLSRHVAPSDRKNTHSETFVDPDGKPRTRAYSNFDLAWECLLEGGKIQVLAHNRQRHPLWQRTGFVVNGYAGDRDDEEQTGE